MTGSAYVDVDPMISSQRPRARGLGTCLSPLVFAIVVLTVAIVLASWAWGRLQQAQRTAKRWQQNVVQARARTEALKQVMPPHMPAGGHQHLVEQLEKAIVTAGTTEQAVNSVTVQSLGALANVASVKYQARVQLQGLTLLQMASALELLENGGQTCWVDSVDLTASQSQGDAWNAVVQVQWLQRVDRTPVDH